MNKIIIPLAFIVSSLNSFGQELNSFKSSTVYGEIFGNSLNQITINYERVFSDKTALKLDIGLVLVLEHFWLILTMTDMEY